MVTRAEKATVPFLFGSTTQIVVRTTEMIILHFEMHLSLKASFLVEAIGVTDDYRSSRKEDKAEPISGR